MFMQGRALLALLGAATASACSTSTDELQPMIVGLWTDDFPSITVSVSLVTPSGPNATLPGGDTLTMTVNGLSSTLMEDDFVDPPSPTVIWYYAYLPEAGMTGPAGAIAVALTGDSGDAPASSFEIPDDLTIAPITTMSRAGELVVSWSPIGSDAMTWRASDDCGTGSNVEESPLGPDIGTWTMPAGTLVGEGTCSGELDLYRTRSGALDPAFRPGGTIVGKREVTIKFDTTP